MDVRDIKGAYPTVGGVSKIRHKQFDTDGQSHLNTTSYISSMTDGHGQVVVGNNRKIYDTKRFMRCNDIDEAFPKPKLSVN